MEPGFAKRLVGVLRAVYHMLRRGLCRKRLMMDLHLLLGRGKLAGKALRNLVAAAHHMHGAAAAGGGHMVPASSSSSSSGGARVAAAAAATSSSSTLDFSCTTTPSYEPTMKALFPFKIRGRGGAGGRKQGGGLDVAEVARAFEMMNAQEAVAGTSGSETPSVATPSPMLALSLGRSPAGVRQLRVTDSPFPEEPVGVNERVDAEAANFIKRFYEQLRMQQAFATPDNSTVRRRG
ncbi:hypothetical protein QOZ80_1BG0062180 [Eleusine coracana subsp. coracana]|nr:hypothetical protein QOZ80_1BG0062180 [Eleusine coracana subsp. coracana]